MPESYLEKEESEKLISACPLCGKAKESASTFTSWLKGNQYCRCSKDSTKSSIDTLYKRNRDTIYSVDKNTEAMKAPDLGDSYEVKEVLGAGGMGTVFRVVEKASETEYALKVMRQEVSKDKQLVKRFKLEAKAAESLDHENLIPVYGQGKTEDDLPYLLMGLSKGKSLQEILKSGERLDHKQVLDIIEQVAMALKHAHDKGIVHRDVKPSNIMIETDDSGANIVRMLDFGIAKVSPIENKVGQGLTMTGEFLGTPDYMSPENCLGKAVDKRSDIYSLGCLLYELLTGAPPFTNINPIQTIVSHINAEPKQFAKDLQIEENLQKFVFKSLVKEPSDRYQSMDEYLKDLADLKAGKKLRIKLEPRKESVQQESKLLLAVLVFTLMLIATPVIYFFSISQGGPDRAAMVPRSKPAVETTNAGESPLAKEGVYQIKNEFDEVLFEAEGKDYQEAARKAIVGAVKKKISFVGVEFNDLNLSKLDLGSVDFSSAKFSNVDFSSSNLKGARFAHCLMSKCKAINANLTRANFTSSTLRDVDLNKAILKEIDFSGARLSKINFENVVADRAIFKGTWINVSQGKRANFQMADFDGARIQDSNFVRGNFKEAYFGRGSITHNDFSAADFSKAVLNSVLARRNKFNNVNFSGAKMKSKEDRYFKTQFRDSTFNGAKF